MCLGECTSCVLCNRKLQPYIPEESNKLSDLDEKQVCVFGFLNSQVFSLSISVEGCASFCYTLSLQLYIHIYISIQKTQRKAAIHKSINRQNILPDKYHSCLKLVRVTHDPRQISVLIIWVSCNRLRCTAPIGSIVL